MLQLQVAALRGLQRRHVCSACLISPNSSLQTWRRLATIKSQAPSQALSFGTSTPKPADSTTDAASETESKNVPEDALKADQFALDMKPIPRRKMSRLRKADKPKKPFNSTSPAHGATPTSGKPSKDEMILNQVLNSLKKLEKNYASLSAGVDKLNTNGKTKTSGQSTSSPDEGAPNDTPEVKGVATTELKTKMKTIAATLDVLKNVLHSQNIPIEGLGKKSKKKKQDAKDISGPSTPQHKKTPQSSENPTGEAKAVAWPKNRSAVGPRVATSTSAPTPAPKAPGATLAKAAASAAAKTQHIPFVKAAAAGSLAARLSKGAAQPAKSSPFQQVMEAPRLAKKQPDSHVHVETLSAESVQLTPVEQPSMPPVAKLAYGLDRVLFNPGVYQLQDPRSKVYNFDPYLSKIMPLNEFDFGALQRYVTSSKDSTLYELAAKLGKKYSGSTSSMTSMLGHFHFLLSNWRPVAAKYVSRSFPLEYDTFNAISRAPAATFLHLRDGVYSIDADKEHDSANILSMLGKSMEKLLTLSKEDFERYRHANSAQITEEERNAAEAYHFSTLGDFLMRSQLDATDPRLPGTGMFDLKTRAVISIRMDAAGFQKGLGYEIRDRFGEWESFEREYYDMIRSAFLKYSLQVRMGRMDGIYVAYHNTQRIFGFQYIPLAEMDQALHGSDSTALGDEEFKLSLQLLNKVLDRATERFPGRNLRLHVETRPGKPPFMYIFAKPVTPAEIEKVQTANHAAIAQFENKFLGLQRDEAEAEMEAAGSDTETQQTMSEDGSQAALPREDSRQDPFEYWEQMREQVEEAVEDDARGISHVRDAIQDALEQSGLLKAKSPVEARTHVESLLDALVRTDEQDLVSPGREQPNDAAQQAVPDEQRVHSGSSTPADFVDGASGESGAQEADISPATSVHPGATESSRASDGSLKDLIVKVAERLDERSEEAGGRATDDDVSDKSQLREFERILSDLIANRSAHATTTVEEAEEPMSIDFDEPRLEPSAGKPSDLVTDAGEDADAEASPETDATLSVDGDEILGMHLMIRNLINGKYVDRPPSTISERTKWTVEYSIEEIPTKKAKDIYQAIQQRRKKAFENGDEERRDANWRQMFKGRLEHYSLKGRKHRAIQDLLARDKPVYTADSEEPISHAEAFAHHRQWKELDLKK